SIQASGIVPDVVVKPEGAAPDAVLGQDGQLYVTEATLPGHLRGDDEGLAGYTPGDVLDGDAPVKAALAELKKLAVTARARTTAVPR
ncbi:MAG TPA: peptidase S41, partial [Pseudoxanthomonas sp.]